MHWKLFAWPDFCSHEVNNMYNSNQIDNIINKVEMVDLPSATKYIL